MVVPVRYEEDDIPNDFPFRIGDTWLAVVNIDTGQIDDWPQGRAERVQMKVCDEGSYYILDKYGHIVLSIVDDYVPNGLIPGRYGDYIDLKIDENGFITNWPKNPSIAQFQEGEDG